MFSTVQKIDGPFQLPSAAKSHFLAGGAVNLAKYCLASNQMAENLVQNETESMVKIGFKRPLVKICIKICTTQKK